MTYQEMTDKFPRDTEVEAVINRDTTGPNSRQVIQGVVSGHEERKVDGYPRVRVLVRFLYEKYGKPEVTEVYIEPNLLRAPPPATPAAKS